MRNWLKISLLFSVFLLVFTACKVDEDPIPTPANKYTIKILKAEGVILTQFKVKYDGQETNVPTNDLILNEDFERTYEVNDGKISASAIAVGNDDSVLTMQLIKNGNILKENKTTGRALSLEISN